MRKRIAWQLLVWSIAALAVWVARKLTRSVWTRVSDSDDPANPFDESTTWVEAASLAAVVALVAALARRLHDAVPRGFGGRRRARRLPGP